MNQRPRQARSLVDQARAATAVCIGGYTRLAARRVTQFLDRRLAPTGLNLAQFGLMAHIAAAADDTLSALAERTGLDQSTLSRNLGGLERDGLVEIATAADDQRRRMVWLTETGARTLEAALPVWRQAHEDLSAVVDPALAQALANATQALTRL